MTTHPTREPGQSKEEKSDWSEAHAFVAILVERAAVLQKYLNAEGGGQPITYDVQMAADHTCGAVERALARRQERLRFTRKARKARR